MANYLGFRVGTTPFSLIRRRVFASAGGRITGVGRELRAIDELVAEYAERFDGLDPLRPEFRRALDARLERCQALRAELCEFIGEWALPDDHSKELDQLRALAKRILE